MGSPQPVLAAAGPTIAFDDRTDWDDFPSAGFPVTGTLDPPSSNWSQVVAQVWSEDFSTLIIDNIAVTFDGPGGTWSIDNDFTGTLTTSVNYQLVVKGVYLDANPSQSHAFTKN